MRRLCLLVIISAGWTAAGLAAMNFGLDDQLYFSGGLTADQTAPDIVTDGNYTHLTYFDNRTLNDEVWYARLGQFGVITYDQDFDVVQYPAASVHPRIARDPNSGALYVAFVAPQYNPFHVYVRRSDDGGQSWTTAVQVDDGAGMPAWPDITVLPTGRVVVVWQDWVDSSDCKIVTDFSSDSGDTWGFDITLPNTSGPLEHDTEPAVDSDDAGNVYAVWAKGIGWGKRIYFAVSNNGGSTYNTPMELNPPAQQGYDDVHPDIAAWGDGRLAVVWAGSTLSMLESDILAAGSTDGGVSWANPNPLVVHHVSGESNDYPRIDNDLSDSVYVVWRNQNAASAYHVRIARFPVLMTGSELEQAAVDNSPDCGGFPYPSVAVSASGRVTVMWSDSRTGTYWHLFADKTEPTFHDSFTDPVFGEWELHDGVQLDFGLAFDFNGSSARMGTLVRAPGLLEQVWPAEQTGTVSFWFYDGYPDPDYTNPASGDWQASLEYDDGAKAGVVRTLGVVNPSSTTHYSTSTNGGASWQVSSVPRSNGWHAVEFEVTGSGLTAKIDPSVYSSANPVMQDAAFTKFDTLTFAGGSFAAPYNVDELNCETVDASSLVPALSPIGLLLLAGALGWLASRRRR